MKKIFVTWKAPLRNRSAQEPRERFLESILRERVRKLERMLRRKPIHPPAGFPGGDEKKKKAGSTQRKRHQKKRKEA